MSLPLSFTPRVTDDIKTALATYDERLQQLLFSRGLTDAQAVEKFLSPSYDDHLHDPFLLNTMNEAANRIKAAMTKNEHIALFGDYDCDGIPGTVVLADLFSALEYNQVTPYIPHRHYEGFGLSSEAVEKLHQQGVTLIITIDCGTSDRDAVARAAELGIDVIITDHHEPPAELPPAVAIVNPKLGTYPFPDLCGTAVAFKLAQAVLSSVEHALVPGREKWWLDMVGLATVADMVPLHGENRVFATYGLTVLRKSRRPGLQQLLRKAKAEQRHLTEDDIGFTIGPRINAASRMDAPERALALLVATTDSEAGEHVSHLESLNNERKGVVATMTRELHSHLQTLTDIPSVIVYGNPNWRPALAGLSANKIAEEFSRPTFVWGRDGNNTIKGSCRAGGGVSVVRLMEEAAFHFLEYGGHHASGGFAVQEQSIFSLSETLNEAFVSLGEEASVPRELLVDLEASLDEVATLHRVTAPLAPFGAGNPKPLFAFRNVSPRSVDIFGKGKEHLKLTFTTNVSDIEAIAFFSTATDFSTIPEAGKPCTLLAHIEESFFMRRRQLRLRIVDIV